MSTKDNLVSRSLVANRQLKEWNDNVASEIDDHYRLNSIHQVERDRFALEHGTDLKALSALISRQKQDLIDLKEQHSNFRVSMQERHRKEKSRFEL